MRWTGQKPMPGGGLGRFALKAKTSISSGTIALSGVNVELDGNAAEGVLTFASDGRQTLQGTLAAEELDLTPYVSTVRLIAANERDWNEFPIVLDGLTGVDFDLRMSAAKITIGRVKLGNTAIAANLRAGKLSLTVAQSQAFGGLIKGSMTLAATDTGADVKSEMQFTDVDLEGCLGGLFNIRRIEGRGNLSLAIEASGGSVLALTQHLSGSAGLNARDGALLRINAEQLLGRLMRRPLSGASDFRTGRTPYERLIVNLKIVQGMANIEEARLDGPKVRMTFTGSSSIPTRELDLRGQASLYLTRASDAAPAFDLGFIVTGSWDDPLPLFDTKLIERSPSGQQLRDAVRRDRSPPPPVQGGGNTTDAAIAPVGAPGEPSAPAGSNTPASAPLASEPVSTTPADPRQ
jgi:AsmA protein